MTADFFHLGNGRFRGVSKSLKKSWHFFQGPVTRSVQPRTLDVGNITKMSIIIENQGFLKGFGIFKDLPGSHETVTTDGPPRSDSGLFPPRKRAFPRRFEMFEIKFAFFQGPVTRSVQPRTADVGNITKISIISENQGFLMKFDIFKDLPGSHETVITDGAPRSVSGLFSHRKRAFPRRFEMFEIKFAFLSRSCDPFGSAENLRCWQDHQNVENH